MSMQRTLNTGRSPSTERLHLAMLLSVFGGRMDGSVLSAETCLVPAGRTACQFSMFRKFEDDRRIDAGKRRKHKEPDRCGKATAVGLFMMRDY